MAIDPTPPQGMRHDTTALAAQLEADGEKTHAETEKKGEQSRAHEMAYQAAVRDGLEKAFEVTLSNTRERNEKAFSDLTSRHEHEVNDTVAKGEKELERIRTRYEDQIAQYRENAERMMADDEKKRTETFANMERMRRREKV